MKLGILDNFAMFFDAKIKNIDQNISKKILKSVTKKLVEEMNMQEIAADSPLKFSNYIWMLGSCGNIDYNA